MRRLLCMVGVLLVALWIVPLRAQGPTGTIRGRVTDSSGLQSSQSVTIFPDKVNLGFNTLPAGVTLYLDGIAHTTPFTYDTLIGFNHEIEARIRRRRDGP